MHREPALAFLIADGARARLMLRHGAGRYELVAKFHHKVVRGRGRDVSAVTQEEDDKGRQAFAAELAEAVDGFVAQGRVDRLALVAPPKMLAAIRHNLSGRAGALVATALAKDLTKLPEAELRPALDALVLPSLSQAG